MAEQSSHVPDGPHDEGTRTFLGDECLPLYAGVWQQARSLEAPVFLHAGNPHERLFVAALDGTGSDFFRDPRHATNVGLIYDQIRKSTDGRIDAQYLEGTGTESNWLSRIADGARGYTVDERAEDMYKRFIDQARQWIRDDPSTKVNVASVGFSRGGEEVALFARLVEGRGIQDPMGAHYTYDAHHRIKYVEYTQPALVGAGKVAQAVALFDPVGTGQPMHEDRRLPPSVISGIQFNAMDEHRRLFPSDRIIDPGITMEGRFAGFNLPGAHSDIGGGYLLNGLSNRAGNIAIAYLNALSDRQYLEPLPEFDDPGRNVIHRSEDGMFLYGADYKVDRSTPGGYNEVLVDKRMAAQIPDANNAEPRNEALDAKFEHQTIIHAMRNPMLQSPAAEPPPRVAGPNEFDQLIDRLYQAALHNDAKAMDAVTSDYLRTPRGHAWQEQVMRSVQVVPSYPAVEPSMRQPADGPQAAAQVLVM